MYNHEILLVDIIILANSTENSKLYVKISLINGKNNLKLRIKILQNNILIKIFKEAIKRIIAITSLGYLDNISTINDQK